VSIKAGSEWDLRGELIGEETAPAEFSFQGRRRSDRWVRPAGGLHASVREGERWIPFR
jgi:hypothetical protein